MLTFRIGEEAFIFTFIVNYSIMVKMKVKIRGRFEDKGKLRT